MPRLDYEPVDRAILEAIQSHPEVPTPKNLSWHAGGPLAYSHFLILRRLARNPSLDKALQSKGMKYVRTCNGDIFAKTVKTSKWKKVHVSVHLEIYRRLDNQIRDAITSFQGAPTANSLSKSAGGPLPYSYKLIAGRTESNNRLRRALERKGIACVSGCDYETFVKGVVGCTWNGVPGKVRCAMEKRIDDGILQAIRSFPGVPTPKNLSKSFGGPLPYAIRLVKRRFNTNPSLGKELAGRGAEYVRTCDDKIFARAVAASKWNGVSQKVRCEINKRLDTQILDAIRAFQGVPTVVCLSKSAGGPLPYSCKLIARRTESNKRLKSALERTGIAYVTGCDHETFVKGVVGCTWNGVPGKVRCAMEKRIDDGILQAIRSFPGVPTPKNLSKSFGGSLVCGYILIDTRIKLNNRLQLALEKRGISYVRGCDPETFARAAVSGKWKCVASPVRRFIAARLDKEILRGIRSSPSVPSVTSLTKSAGGPLPYNYKVLRDHIDYNPGLTRALNLKKEGAAIQSNTVRLVADFYSRNPLAALADALPRQVISFSPPRAMVERPQFSVAQIVRRLRQS